jgi:hypothetical protein
MTDPERDHFVRQIRDLERRLRRWRPACLALLGLLLLPVVLGGLLGVAWVPRLERERAMREEELRDRLLYFKAVQRATEVVGEQAEQQAQEAEEEAPPRAQQGPGEAKD